ncbi:error-prone DNA polymerase [bacterium]|nr:error-prone DNA polymerase [bacterium]
MNPRTPVRYAELTCRTHYSFLRGASHPHELVQQAAELGLSALAITDRNGVYGIPKAYRAWKELSEEKRSALRLIIGSELTLRSSSEIQESGLGADSLILLARTRRAYGLLCRLITEAHAGKEKGNAFLSPEILRNFIHHPDFNLPLREIAWISPPPLNLKNPKSKEWLRRTENLLERNLSVYYPIFQFRDAYDAIRLRNAETLAKRFGERTLIAANDVHTHHEARRPLQEVLTSIRETTPLKEAGFKLFQNGERRLKSSDEMLELFSHWPQLLTQAHELSREFQFDLSELRYRYPSEWIPPGYTAQSYLSELTWKGASDRYGGELRIPEATRKQLLHELALIDQLGFADYFLTIWEIVDYARSKKILCQGRGSAANSAVCYCLGITAIDPVRMNLLFERFISVERGEPPDIDVDFEHERREEVIQHVYQKYGRHRAGMVAALITYRSRSAFREVSKALGFQPNDEKSIDEAKRSPLVERFSEEIYGFPRHLSIHSGGFTLSADPLIETVPIEPARMEGRTIVQWDKDDLDAVGLLKVDLLSLGMLSAMRKCLQLVEKQLHEIPAEDPKTYQMIQRADTVGVFQIESRAQMSMLPRLLPKTFYDLVVEVAIVRPGPIVGRMVHPYLRRKRGLEPVIFPDERLRPILERTLGVPLFQEQVMKIAITLAGFTPGEADRLRRAIGAWRSSGSINEMGKKLMDGLRANGLPQAFADQIFEQIQGFAEYGFPESHAASFALLAYGSAYLKCHHPAEFACALINSQPMGFYANHTLIDDAKRHGVRVLPIDPHFSEWDCTIESGALRLGFRLTRGMSLAEFRSIEESRLERPFQSLSDFLARTKVRKNILNTLALGDAFSCFGEDRRHTLWKILAAEKSHDRSMDGVSEQLSLFAGQSTSGSNDLFSPLTALESIQSDYRSFGVSTRGHPMQELRQLRSDLPKITTAQAKTVGHLKKLTISGLVIVMQRPPTAKGTCFATLEDETGFLDLILRKEVFEKYRELFESGSIFTVTGKMQRSGDKHSHSAQVLVDQVQTVH